MGRTSPDWSAVRTRDRKLVAACLRGEEAAWTELWERYGPLVKAVSRRVGCDGEEAREVLQRVALVTLKRLDTLREPEKLAGWLAGIARLQSLEVIRQRRPSQELHPWSAVHDPDPSGELQREEELAVLRRALLALEERCRRIIGRLDLKEPPDSYQEVAEAEGLATSSVGPIRRRCLNRLRKLVESLSRSDGPAH